MIVISNHIKTNYLSTFSYKLESYMYLVIKIIIIIIIIIVMIIFFINNQSFFTNHQIVTKR